MMMMQPSFALGGSNENSGSSLTDASAEEDATAINTSFNRGSGEMYESDEEDPEWKKWNAWTRRRMQLKRWQDAQTRDDHNSSVDLNNVRDSKSMRCAGGGRSPVKQIQFSEPTLFLAACASGDYDEIDRLLRDCRVDINVSNVDGLTALHYACIDDNCELVRHLLQAGANVNAIDNEGWSVLHATASCGHVKVAEILLQFGADSSLVNVDGELPIDLADDERMRTLLAESMRSRGLTDLERLRTQEHEHMRQDVLRMIQTGIYDEHVHELSGATILHVAACKGYLDVLEMLFSDRKLRSQVRLDVIDSEGWTPLAAAAYWSHPMIVELLLLHGADPNALTSAGQPIDQLTEHELIHQLLKKRRKQIKDEMSRNQTDKDSQAVISAPSTPVAESETQRKAHAKRARESRRSTQGISADDVNRAKDQLLLANTDTTSLVTGNGLSHTLDPVIEEVSSPPIFTATLVRPPLPPTVAQNRSFGNIIDSNESTCDQQLNATIRLSQSDFEFESEKDVIEAEPVIYRRNSQKSQRDSIDRSKAKSICENLVDRSLIDTPNGVHTSIVTTKDSIPAYAIEPTNSSEIMEVGQDCEPNHVLLIRTPSLNTTGVIPTSDLYESRADYGNSAFESVRPYECNFVDTSSSTSSPPSASSSSTAMQDHNQHSSGTMIETAPTAAPYGSDLDDEMSSRCSSPDSSHLQPVKFNVPVLIETPCTPEPPDFVASANNEVSCEEMPNSFVDASEEPIAAEHTLSRRRKPKKRSNMSLPSAEDIGMFEQLTMADSNNGSLPTISSLASNGSNFSGRDVNDFGTKTLVSLEMNQPKPNNIYTKQSSLDSMTPFNKYQSGLRNRPRSSFDSASSTPSDPISIDRKESLSSGNVTSDGCETGPADCIGSNDPNNQPKDYKKLYEQLLVEFEAYKQEVGRKEQEWNREKRQMQRKLGELEEELKQVETLKQDNLRLKEENGALIRVISKLSKGSSN